MANFFTPNQPPDQDAVRKAMLLAMMGGQPGAAPAAGPGVTMSAQPTTATTQPDASTSTPATPFTTPTTATPAKPLSSSAASGNNVEPGNQPPPSLSGGDRFKPGSAFDPAKGGGAIAPAILSENDWAKQQGPTAPHTPYVAPDLKHRMLEGIFAGMQEFGRPGEGATTVRSYLDNIRQNLEGEKNYPQAAATQQHQNYENYVAGAKAPVELESMNAELEDRRAQAAERNAHAAELRNPPQKLQHVALTLPNGESAVGSFDPKTGKYLDSNTQQPLEGAKPLEKEKTQNDFEQYYGQWMKDNAKPDTAANRLAAHKEWEIKPEQPGANDTRMDRSYQYNNNIVEKQRTPIDQRLERLDRVEQAINQKSPQADALIAPELLSVMVGGQGSGLRMNEAEISRVVGGRSKWEDLKAALQKWDPNSGKALSVTDSQRQQMRDILSAVRDKTTAKQEAFNDAQTALSQAQSVEEHRKITGDLKRKLSAIDSGEAHGQSGAERGNNSGGGPQKVFSDADVQAAVQAHPGLTADQAEQSFKAKGWSRKQ